jgi:HEAT repeats
MHDEDLRNQLPDDLKSLWEKLDSIPPQIPDSPAMRTRFNAMLDACQENINRSVHWWPLRPAIQFVAAVLILAMGITIGTYFPINKPLQQSPDLNELRREVGDLREIVALSLMQQQSATERLRGVSWSNQINDPDGKVLSALLDTLMHDSNINVRLAAIDALRRFGDRQIVRKGALQALSEQESPLVQVALIDFMVEVREKDSVPALRELMADRRIDESIRTHAAWGVEQFQ